MRFVKIAIGVAALVYLGSTPADAGQRGSSGTHAPSTHAAAPPTHGPSSTSHGSSTTTTHGPSTHTESQPGAGSSATKGNDATSTAASSTSTSTTASTPTTTAVNFTAGPVAQKLSRNTALTSKIQSRLQAEGYTGTVYQAAYGFKNLGQFVAATNVSRNLGISFEQLKLQMTGLSVKPDGTVLEATRAADGSVTMVDPSLATNPAPTKSLGQAIQTVKPGADATTSAQTATTQATAEIGSTSGTTTTGPTTTSGSTATKKPRKSSTSGSSL